MKIFTLFIDKSKFYSLRKIKIIDVFLNQKRVNACKHTVKTGPCEFRISATRMGVSLHLLWFFLEIFRQVYCPLRLRLRHPS